MRSEYGGGEEPRLVLHGGDDLEPVELGQDLVTGSRLGRRESGGCGSHQRFLGLGAASGAVALGELMKRMPKPTDELVDRLG
jgi:hypothetical protein